MRRKPISALFNDHFAELVHMRVVEDEDGERFLEIESKEDLEEFREMLIEAYYELSPARKPPYETRSPK